MFNTDNTKAKRFKPNLFEDLYIQSTKVFFILMVFLSVAKAEDWVAVKDTSLIVEPSTILDFSNINSEKKLTDQRVVINADGRFVLENKSDRPQRFLIGSISFGMEIPSHKIIDLYVEQFRLRGYNMARLDFLELTLMNKRKGDFDYNPEQLDRFYYLVSALKKNGIYLILNGLSNDNGGYGNVSERWIGKKGLGLGVYFDTEKQAHWKKLMSTMYGSVNPYTGVSILKDPTLAGIILVNENNLVFVNRNGVAPEVKLHFAKWLKTKYGNNTALKSAWGSELKADESVDSGSVNLPAPDAWTSKRMADAQQFFFESEKKTVDWMTLYLRGLGYQGLVTAYNVWHSPASQASRGQLQWVDLHNYFGHPEYYSAQDIRVRQDSMLQTGAVYIRELMSAKHIGKPFTVTEHGQVFWNQYRRENGLALPAYAAFQGWDGICQHSSAVSLSYSSLNGKDMIIQPFNVGVDPIARATETLAALLYVRGDVAPAKHILGINLTSDDAFVKSAYLGNTPSDISQLGLVTGIGLDWQGKTFSKAKQTQYDGQVDYNQQGLKLKKEGVLKPVEVTGSTGVKLDSLMKKYAPGVAYKASKIKALADERWSARLQILKEAGWLPTGNLSSADEGIYQSDTGELVLNAQEKWMTVITPKTEAVVFDDTKPINLNLLKVLSAESGALVAVSAMDNQPLLSSKRMLVVLSTDARNSDMRFSDDTNFKATDLGHLPVLIRANKVKLALKNTNQSQLKGYSVNLRGQRQDAIALKQISDSIEFELDVRKLSHGATTYFEIAAE